MNNLKTSNIKPNVPPKVLSGVITDVVNYERWDFPNGSDDPWWSQGSQPRYYRFRYSIEVDSRQHGSHLTREPFEYNGLDITVGDYMASPEGRVMKIISVLSKDSINVEVVAEDYIRYNTFNSSEGIGFISSNINCLLFEVNESIKPLFSFMPTNFAFTSFYSRVDSYFKFLNPTSNFLMKKNAHGFIQGDIISIEANGDIVLTNDQNTGRMIGNVSHIMGPDHFMVKPINDIYDYRPALPGNPGDFLYADNNGKITTQKTNKLLFLKLLEAIATKIIGTSSSPTLTSGDVLHINDESITVGTNVQSVVDAINNLPSTLYFAEVVGSPITAVSSTETLEYGLVGGYIPFSAEINGTLVEFNDDTSGFERYGISVADEFDMRDAINSANITNIVASVQGSELVIESQEGEAINITNITNDQNNTPFAGTSSCTGLPLTTAASTDERLSLERIDGGELKFRNGDSNTDDVVNLLGIYNTHNGAYPTVLYVEQGIRKGDVYVVEDDTQRQNLDVLPGDAAYVIDSGNGEWNYWLYTTSGWSLIATQDSARTDADALELELTYQDSGTNLIGTVSDNSRVSDVTVTVNQPFDDPNATIDVGDSGVNDRLISNSIVDLSELGGYTFNPTHVYKPGGDTDLNVYLNAANSTQGSVHVVITYT